MGVCVLQNRFILVLSYVIYIFYVFVTLVSCILPSHVLYHGFFEKKFFLVFCVFPTFLGPATCYDQCAQLHVAGF
jgi:hypothetical protein